MRESIQLSSEELLQHADFMYTQYNWTVWDLSETEDLNIEQVCKRSLCWLCSL
jgi:hypothetical protein